MTLDAWRPPVIMKLLMPDETKPEEQLGSARFIV